jgi:hypothetical protein
MYTQVQTHLYTTVMSDEGKRAAEARAGVGRAERHLVTADVGPRRREADDVDDDQGDVWAIEQLRSREWRVSSLHWSRASAEDMLRGQTSGRDPERWRVQPWLVHGAPDS